MKANDGAFEQGPAKYRGILSRLQNVAGSLDLVQFRLVGQVQRNLLELFVDRILVPINCDLA